MRITNSQKKELFEIFSKSGLNKSDFETSGQFKEFKIKYKYDYFSFLINYHSVNVYNATIFPINNTKGYSESGNWLQIKGKFEIWIRSLQKELNTATGWESFENDNFLHSELIDLEEKFTETEKIQVRISIGKLKENIKKIELSPDSLNILQIKLDELDKKIDQLKKFDWKSLFVGTIATLIMTLSIPPEASGLLWLYISNAFASLKLK